MNKISKDEMFRVYGNITLSFDCISDDKRYATYYKVVEVIVEIDTLSLLDVFILEKDDLNDYHVDSFCPVQSEELSAMDSKKGVFDDISSLDKIELCYIIINPK